LCKPIGRMAIQQYIHIGKIVATFGTNGQVIVQHVLGKKTALKGIKAIFIEQNKNSYLPYFVETAKPKNTEETFVQLEGVGSKEAAHRFLNKNVWLPEADAIALMDVNAPIALLGYTIVEKQKTLGTIEEVITQPHQVLVRISIEGKEVLIPLHEDTLQKIDRKRKEVWVNLPEGLLAIYL